jgi:predicted RNA-binding protein with PIN domain
VQSETEETIIIDGYNLLRRAFRFLEEEHGLEAARSKLEVRLREFVRSRGAGLEVVLIYDGALGLDRVSTRSEPGLQVVFSRPPQNADQAVLAEVRRRGTRERITVVTSDLKDVALPLRQLRARHLTSEEFAEEMDEALGRSRPSRDSGKAGSRPSGGGPGRPEKPEQLSSGEVDEWLRIFTQPKPQRPDRPGHP